MAETRASAAPVVLRLGLAGLFLFVGGQKLLGGEAFVRDFERYGYPDWFVTAIGVAELLGAGLLAAKRTLAIGATLLAAVMVGAASTLYSVGDGRQALVPLVVLGGLGYVGWHSARD